MTPGRPTYASVAFNHKFVENDKTSLRTVVKVAYLKNAVLRSTYIHARRVNRGVHCSIVELFLVRNKVVFGSRFQCSIALL